MVKFFLATAFVSFFLGMGVAFVCWPHELQKIAVRSQQNVSGVMKYHPAYWPFARRTVKSPYFIWHLRIFGLLFLSFGAVALFGFIDAFAE